MDKREQRQMEERAKAAGAIPPSERGKLKPFHPKIEPVLAIPDVTDELVAKVLAQASWYWGNGVLGQNYDDREIMALMFELQRLRAGLVVPCDTTTLSAPPLTVKTYIV